MDKQTLQVTTVVSNVEGTFDLRIYHRQKQPEPPHPCRENNGGCEHFCLPMWKKNITIAQCLCAQGYKLSPASDKQCVFIKDEPLLLYSTRGYQRSMISAITLPRNNQQQQPFTTLHQAIIPVYNISAPMWFDVDEKEKTIYFVSVHK